MSDYETSAGNQRRGRTDNNSFGNDFKHWLLLGLAGFGLGTVFGGVAHQSWQKALLTGAIGAPVVCVGNVLMRSRQSSSSEDLSIPSETTTPQSPIQPQVAVFWDHENIHTEVAASTKLATAIADIAQELGHPRQKCVYSNWNNEATTVTQSLASYGFSTIQVSMGKTNSVDIRLAVDCIATAYQHPEITHFVLVTSDKDYIPLVHQLRSMQRQVILVSRSQATSKHLRDSVDRHIPLNQLLPESTSGSVKSRRKKSSGATLSFEEGTQCLLTVLEQITQGGEPRVVFSRLNDAMREQSQWPYHNASSICKPDSQDTFRQFSQFVQAVEKTGKIIIYRDGMVLYASIGHQPPPSALSFEEATQCVLYALAQERQQKGYDELQEINIAHLPLLVRQHLGFDYFAKTSIFQVNSKLRFKTLSKFLDAVAETHQIQMRRDNHGAYVRLMKPPIDPIPESLVQRLRTMQVAKATEQVAEASAENSASTRDGQDEEAEQPPDDPVSDVSGRSHTMPTNSQSSTQDNDQSHPNAA